MSAGTKYADYANIHNYFTSVLHDGADDRFNTLGPQGYSIAEQPDTVHTLTLQKSSGALCIAAWNERFTGGEDNVTFLFNSVHEAVNIYDITAGTEAVNVLNNVTSFTYTLSDYPIIFEVIG